MITTTTAPTTKTSSIVVVLITTIVLFLLRPFPPPLAIRLIRLVRPVLPILGFFLYTLYRSSFLLDSSSNSNTTTTSLLRVLLNALTWMQEEILLQLDQWQQQDDDSLSSSLSYFSVFIVKSVHEWIIESCFVVLEDLLAVLAVLALIRLVYTLTEYSIVEWKDMFIQQAFDWARTHIPFVRQQLDQSVQDGLGEDCEERLLHKNKNRVLTCQLPTTGRSAASILEELEFYAQQEHKRWESGKVSGTVYSESRTHTQLMNRVYSIYAWSNPLHPGFWPKLSSCEGEVISMTSHLLHGTVPGIGCITSGGTESIILAIRAHLQYYGKRRGISDPEIICGTTAHAALDKACEMFGIRKVVIDCDSFQDGYQLMPDQVRRRITSNTIMIYASAPCYPQGVIDPIDKLSDLAVQYDIGLHVDACLGGFVLPFVQQDDDDDSLSVPAFDFRLPGVTSMSADTHKYGYASKGTSVVLYRHKELRHCQYFSFARWTGGLYSTPTIAGSRNGALSACAWAAMLSMGQEGYQTRVRSIVRAAREIAKGLARIRGIRVLTRQPYMVVCFGATPSVNKDEDEELDIYRVQDYMTAAGWSLNTLQHPASLHICVTLNVVPQVQTFLVDVEKAVEKVREEGSSGRTKGTAGMYGMVGSLPPGPIECTLNALTDLTLAP